MQNNTYKMGHGAPIGDGTGSLSLVSGIMAILTLANIQPIFTFLASVIAIVSGLISIYKKLNSKK